VTGSPAWQIDQVAITGLLGMVDSLAYRVHEIERHVHSWSRWFGAANTPDGELHVADRIGKSESGGSETPFVIDAGNDDWGDWVQILGSTDTPAELTKVGYDLHKWALIATEKDGTHFIQFAFGTSGAAALAAGTYSEMVFWTDMPQNIMQEVSVQHRRVATGTKMWARAFIPTVDTGTVSFFIGLHEYEG